MPDERPDRVTMVAFVATAFCGGANAVAIRLGNAELAPFWGASLRFLGAGLILLLVVGITRKALPRGRALTGVIIYGALDFFAAYMFVYWALREVTAGTAQVVLAVVPLLTLILAAVQRVEPFRLRGLAGGLVAAAGIALVFFDRVEVTAPAALVALVAAALCIAEVGIVVKRFPAVHPVVMNALGMTFGGCLLLALSLATAEPRSLPTEPRTWVSLAYLIVVGSIALFVLYLFVLRRWTASGTSYLMLIFPLITVALGAIILGEAVSPAFVIGGLLVLAGVYVGAIAPATRPKAPEGPPVTVPVAPVPVPMAAGSPVPMAARSPVPVGAGSPVPMAAASMEPARVTLPPCA